MLLCCKYTASLQEKGRASVLPETNLAWRQTYSGKPSSAKDKWCVLDKRAGLHMLAFKASTTHVACSAEVSGLEEQQRSGNGGG